MVPQGIADMTPWRDWTSAADASLRLLHDRIGWDVWLITRVEGDRQVVLRSCPAEAAPPGTEVSWESSFCRQMLAGEAPRIATVTAAVPAYASRTVGPLHRIAAYVGVPLVTGDLEFFGTLCGLATRAQPRSANRELPLVETVARMLSTLMAAGMEPPPLPRPPG